MMEGCTIRMAVTWEHLQTLDNTFLTKTLGRHPEVTKLYLSHLSEPGFKQSLVKKLKQNTKSGICFRENDYPYFLEKGITHYIMWFSDEYHIPMEKATSWVSIQTGKIPDKIVVCCNEQHMKTVPEIQHYHVFLS